MISRKTALVSGGTRGIGLAISQELARQGYNIATFARTPAEVDTFSGKIEALGREGIAFVGDIRDDKFLSHVVEQVLSKFNSLEVLVNNAGGGKQDLILEAAISDWDMILQTNLRAPMVLTKLCLDHLIKNKSSRIINISSMAGTVGISGASAYCASKFGLIGFGESLFEETRQYGVKVCNICPGYVDTKLIPSRKALMREEMIRPEDVANAVKYVLECSPSACPTEIKIRPQKNPFRK